MLDKLKAEAPGVLAWAVAGCLAWQREGLSPSPAVLHATADYRAEMDVLAGFLEECCDTEWTSGIVPETQATRLYAAYRSWAERGGEKVETATRFGARLRERGFERFRKNDGNYYRGITLKSK